MISFKSLFNDLTSFGKEIPRVITVATFLVIAFAVIIVYKGKNLGKFRMVLRNKWLILFFIHLALILTGAILVRQHTNPLKRVFENFGLREDSSWNKEIIENILIFIPYSFLYLRAFKPNGGARIVVFVTFITSCCIEISQLVLWLGSFQFADIVHNCIGGIIGYGIWLFAEWIIKKMRRDNTT